MSVKFKTELWKDIEPGESVTFNETIVTFEKDRPYTLSLTEKQEELQYVRTNEYFKTVEAKIQYIWVMLRPDLSSAAQMLSS